MPAKWGWGSGGTLRRLLGLSAILRTTEGDVMPYPGLAQLKPELQHSHLKQIILRGAESVYRTFGLL